MPRKQIPFDTKNNLYIYKPKGDWVASIAIVIGHSDEDEGAQSPRTGLTEFDYNRPVAHNAATILQDFGVLVDIYERDKWGEYFSMQRVMNERSVKDVDRYEADNRLHLNAYNTRARGTECIHHYASKNGKLLASCTLPSVIGLFGTSRHRGGIVPLYSGDRAYSLVSKGIDPTQIIEAAYIDNIKDEKLLREYWLAYDEALVDSMLRYLQARGIHDPRFEKWSWDGKSDISTQIKEMLGENNDVNDYGNCPVCNNPNCINFCNYTKTTDCKN